MTLPAHESPSRDPDVLQRGPRLWEIDALRGLAVVAMILFHFWWDWVFFRGGWLGPESRYFSGPIAITFLTVLGLSMALDLSKVRARGGSASGRIARRVALIGGAAALVTAVTRLALPEAFVYFGILHLLAVCTLLVGLTSRLGAVVHAVIGLAIIGIGWSGLLAGQAPEAVLSVLGWRAPRSTIDWYPLAPWAGFAFIGYALGLVLYRDGRRRYPIPDLARPTSPLRFLGRHALPVYLVHQLLLLPLAWALARLLP